MERNPKPYLQDSFAIDNETVEDVKGQIGNAELVAVSYTHLRAHET